MNVSDIPAPLPGGRPDERRYDFERVLRANHGRIKETAEALGIHRVTASIWARELRAGRLLDRLPPR